MNKVFNRIESITGNVITVKATGVRYNELAQINTRFGKSLAQVNKIEGDVVSLSPASASFDLYKNFEYRGRHYKDEVNAL